MLVSLKELKGLTIQAKDGEIGKVNDVYFDDRAWVVRYLIDKTGFWLFGQQVLISPASVLAIDMEKHQIRVDLTRDQVANSPKVDQEKPLSHDAENELIQYYHWPTYLGIGGMGVGGVGIGGTDTAQSAAYGQTQVPFPITLSEPRKIVHDEESDGPNIISTDHVLKYPVSTSDGDLGFVSDLIVDLETWEIRYLVIEIDEEKEKKVLIDPEWIDWISWKKRRISVSIKREKIKACPRFDLSLPIQREYENLLYEHYECKKYWERKDAGS
ncbi:MAG: PRC-barrel domain-containing protein [Bacillota bacterium]|nr:PRC-barrel domain-containing protein [Bacillota bacterium]